MCVVIVSRELAITGLRMLAASKNRVLAAERYGKHKTISQMVAIISVLVMKSYPEWGEAVGPVFNPWVPKFAMIAIWISVALTAFSGALYLWRNREVYLSDV
jgi:CDP-diacylglycerol--glycerol-3-phosphate 3-phosphatidyltransferase